MLIVTADGHGQCSPSIINILTKFGQCHFVGSRIAVYTMGTEAWLAMPHMFFRSLAIQM